MTNHRFSAEYKLAILDEYESLTEHGAKGALLTREGLSAGQPIDWRWRCDRSAHESLDRVVGCADDAYARHSPILHRRSGLSHDGSRRTGCNVVGDHAGDSA
ncbi:MAG: hypothetical protein ACYDGN_09340 [Acidimicrobiales bacterium]